MRKIITCLAITFASFGADAQEVKDAKGNLVAYISRFTISDKDKNLLCTFRDDGRIVDPQAGTLGFLDASGDRFRLLDKDRKPVASMLPDGRVYDLNERLIGNISRATGPVMKNGAVIATIDNVEPMWAVCYFFLLKF